MDPRDEPASKGDLDDVQTALKGEIQDVRAALKGEIHDVRAALKGEIHDVQTALKGEIHDVQTALKGEIQDVRTELKGEIHELRVLVEAQQDWPQRILEAMQGMEARLRSDFEKRFARAEMRLDVLEPAARETSERVRENRHALEAVSTDVARLRADVGTLIAKADGVDDHLRRRDTRVEGLERRVSALEAKVTPDD
jgi:chromosome segregation ATPase